MRVWIEGRIREEEVDAIVEILREQGIRVVSFDGEEVKSGDDIWWGAGAGILNSWIVIKVVPPRGIPELIRKRGWRICLFKGRRGLMESLTRVVMPAPVSCKLYKKVGGSHMYKIEGVVDVNLLRLIGTFDDIEIARPYDSYWFSGKVIPEVVVKRLYPVFGGTGFGKGIVSDNMVAKIVPLSGFAERYRAIRAARVLCKDDKLGLRLARVVTGLPIRRCSELDEVKEMGIIWDVVIRISASDAVDSEKIAIAGMVDSMSRA